MIFLAVLFVAIIVLISWIIFMPVNIKINTTLDLYQVSQAGTVVISFHPHEAQPVAARIFGVKVNLRKEKSPGDEKIERKASKKMRKSPEAWSALFNGLLKSFQCRRFACSLDLGDVVLNAQLLPVLYALSRGPVRLRTNFTGEYFLDVFIQARINRMLWPVVRFFLTKK